MDVKQDMNELREERVRLGNLPIPTISTRRTIKIFAQRPEDLLSINEISSPMDVQFDGNTISISESLLDTISTTVPQSLISLLFNGATVKQALLNKGAILRSAKTVFQSAELPFNNLSLNRGYSSSQSAYPLPILQPGPQSTPVSIGNPKSKIIISDFRFPRAPKTKAPQTNYATYIKNYIKQGWNAVDWDAVKEAGITAFFSGCVMGIVDELLELLPKEYKEQVLWIRDTIRTFSTVAGLLVMCAAIYAGGTIGLIPLLVKVVVGMISGYIGGVFGSLIGKILRMCANYLIATFYCDKIIDIPDCIPAPTTPLAESAHLCGLGEDGYFYISSAFNHFCSVCYCRPATFAFVHKEEGVAHMAYCEECSRSMDVSLNNIQCICQSPASSFINFYDAPRFCPRQCCIQIGKCVACVHNKCLKRNTAKVWQLDRKYDVIPCSETEEPPIELLYCTSHRPEDCETFRYGILAVAKQ